MTMTSRAGSYVPPERDKPSFNCPHCGALTGQEWQPLGYPDGDEVDNWASLQSEQVPLPKAAFDEPQFKLVNLWNGAQCYSCEKWSIWFKDTMVHPQRSLAAAPNPDMPEEVQALYSEASQVAAISPRAGAALARAAIERLLKLLDDDAPTGTNLHGYIRRVHDRVSASLGQLLDVVRVTGNQALHIDDQPPDLIVLILEDNPGTGVLETLLETVNDLVDELISRPRRAQELYDRLPAGVRKQAHPNPGNEGQA